VLQQVQLRATVPQPNLATSRILAQTIFFLNFFLKSQTKNLFQHTILKQQIENQIRDNKNQIRDNQIRDYSI
jgi:hypothetical protein